jgi:hypothetical protein
MAWWDQVIEDVYCEHVQGRDRSSQNVFLLFREGSILNFKDGIFLRGMGEDSNIIPSYLYTYFFHWFLQGFFFFFWQGFLQGVDNQYYYLLGIIPKRLILIFL